MRSRLCVPYLVGICLLLTACSAGPTVPTTTQYYNDAKAALKNLDFDAALRNLDRCQRAAADQPIGQQARVLNSVLLVGLAGADKEMAEAYAEGLKQPPAQAAPAPFARMRADYYGMARVHLMNAMQAVMDLRGQLADKPLPLDVPFPDFTVAANPALEKIRSGYQVPDADRFRVQLEADQNALARLLTALVGAGTDPNQGRAAFDKGNVQIDPRTYLLELSDSFIRLSDIWGPRSLDDPRYRRLALQVVQQNLEIVQKLLAAKPDKTLETRATKMRSECENQLKKLPT